MNANQFRESLQSAAAYAQKNYPDDVAMRGRSFAAALAGLLSIDEADTGLALRKIWHEPSACESAATRIATVSAQ